MSQSLIDKILDKSLYGNEDSFISLYKAFEKSEKQQKNLVGFKEYFFPFLMASTLIFGVFLNALIHQLHLHGFFHFLASITPIITYFLLFLHANNDAISKSFTLDFLKTNIKEFENNFLYNDTFIKILEEINFHNFPENEKNKVLEMLANKKVDISALEYVHNQIVNYKKNQISTKIKPQANTNPENIQFFTQT